MHREKVEDLGQLGLFDEPQKEKEPVSETVENPSPEKTTLEAPAPSYNEDGSFALPPDF